MIRIMILGSWYFLIMQLLQGGGHPKSLHLFKALIVLDLGIQIKGYGSSLCD